MKTPTLFELLKAALYIGTVGYGGPAILASMKKVIVNEKKWISEEEFLNALSLAQILPGATFFNMLGYIGYKLKRFRGGFLAPFAFALPAMVSITLLAWAYFAYGNLKFVHSIFMGLGAMVVALLINATMIMGKSIFPSMDRNSYKGMVIAALSFMGIHFLRWNVVYIILISGAMGALFFYFGKDFEPGKKPRNVEAGNDAPKTRGLRFFLPPALLVGGLVIVFWFVVETWTIFSTFGKIGLLAFGGGFTAIPLIQHVVVDGMHWLDLTAFRDGIALGQITPGPVFITATFIGYKVKGIIGAVVATIGIFTPSLVLMMLVSRAHAKIKELKIVKAIIKGFLSGFIGLLLSVVLQFGVESLVDWQTWVVFAVSVLYLLVWKKNVVWLILGTIGVSLLVF
jgi:chromate transporter